MPGFAARFALAFALLYLGLLAASGTAAHRFALETATVRPAAALANAIAPSDAVTARGASLSSGRTRLSVRAGCEGFEAMLLLAAGFAAAPLAWRRRARGMLVGVALLYALNQARIVGLWFALQNGERELFALLHGLVAPVILVAAACACFAWCVRGP